MRAAIRLTPLLLALLAVVRPTAAQDQAFERVEVNVTSVAGDSVFIDRGREAHIEPGDTLRIFPLGKPVVRATIRSVSRSSSRAELRGAREGVDVGARAVVLVPRTRLIEEAEGEAPPPPSVEGPEAVAGPEAEVPQEPQAQAGEEPEHPPWEAGPVEWDEEVPLLAPVVAREPEDRESRLHGRVFTGFDYTNDDEDEGRKYWSSLSGFDVEMDNPFRRGGRLQLEADYYRREADLDGDNDTDSRLRIDRASYRWGGLRGQPWVWEAGRFLVNEFPELGVIDGVEVGHRFDGGHRVGAAVGLFPEWDDEFETGDDFQTSVFYRWVSGEDEALSLGTAYQKTWHDGAADRDLFIGTLGWHPTARSSVFATAWVDYYTDGDEIKGSGVELTQLQVNGNLTMPSGKSGFGLYASHLRWPEIDRENFQALPPDQIDDNEVSRLGLSSWRRLTDHLRLDGRADVWEDQDDSGGSGSLRLAMRDLLYEHGEVGFEVFGSQGKFEDSLGLRVHADRHFDTGFLRLAWDAANYGDFDGDQDDVLQHIVRGSYDTTFGDWDFSVYAEGRLGDEQDSQTVGFFLQRRF